MAHPLAKKAHETSRSKFRSITGVAGGGHAHAGSSHLKKPGAHGVHRHWDGHGKTHILEGKAHGGKSRGRADKYARGGRTDLDWENEDTPGGPWGSESSVAKSAKLAKGDASNRRRGTYEPPQYEDWGMHPASGRKKFKRGGRDKGGRTEKTRMDIDVSRPASQRKNPLRSEPEMLHSNVYGKLTGRGDPGYHSGIDDKTLRDLAAVKRGGRTLARGGRTKGAPKNVTINVRQAPAPAAPPPPPPMPPPAPPGGAPPPAPPVGGGMPGAGAPGGGANPLANLGKGLGFAKGGKVGKHGRSGSGGRPAGKAAAAGHGSDRSIGDSNYDLSHWRRYADGDRARMAEGRVQSHTKGIHDKRSFDIAPVETVKMARGGGLKMTAGAMSGVGRLEQAAYQKRKG